MEIIIILGLILLNGLFSMSEIALISARKPRLEADAKRGSRSAKTALKLTSEPDRFLSTVQIGITLIGILTGLYSGEAFARDLATVIDDISVLAPYALGISTIVIVIVVTYLTLIFGELVPKRIAMNNAEGISKSVAGVMTLLSRIASPFVWLLSKSTGGVLSMLGIKGYQDNKVTEEEIKAIIREGIDTGEVQEVEHDIMERAFSLGDRDVESIMTHRSDLVLLGMEESRERIVEKVMAQMHDIYPVTDGSVDDIAGVVYLKDLFGKVFSDDFDLRSCIRPAQFLAESQSVYNALEQFKAAGVKYGLVIDEFGNMQGMATLTDIMEALVGQVRDEGEQAAITVRDDGTLLVDGQCSFYEFLEYCDLEYLYAGHDHNTLSGLILELLEHIPYTGEKVTWEGFLFEVVDMDGARIDKVLVTSPARKEA